jgi:hypothetical protein
VVQSAIEPIDSGHLQMRINARCSSSPHEIDAGIIHKADQSLGGLDLLPMAALA